MGTLIHIIAVDKKFCRYKNLNINIKKESFDSFICKSYDPSWHSTNQVVAFTDYKNVFSSNLRICLLSILRPHAPAMISSVTSSLN